MNLPNDYYKTSVKFIHVLHVSHNKRQDLKGLLTETKKRSTMDF